MTHHDNPAGTSSKRRAQRSLLLRWPLRQRRHDAARRSGQPAELASIYVQRAAADASYATG
ncbi:hypothetical protein ACVWWI_005751 [Bradyrhizobium sp. USDA 3686]|nr:hypothetical protein [Bradyrhizobium canariense]